MELEYEWVPVGELVPSDYNPREMSPAHMAKLKRSILEFGLVDPLIVNRRDGKRIIVGGHQRWKAANELGLGSVPVRWVELDEGKERALNIALNNAELAGNWDNAKVALLLREIEELDASLLDMTGFSDRQINDFMKQLEKEVMEPIYPLTPKFSEHYDYVVILARNETDWVNLQTIFGLQTKRNYKKESKAGLGMCRVVEFEELEKILRPEA